MGRSATLIMAAKGVPSAANAQKPIEADNMNVRGAPTSNVVRPPTESELSALMHCFDTEVALPINVNPCTTGTSHSTPSLPCSLGASLQRKSSSGGRSRRPVATIAAS